MAQWSIRFGITDGKGLRAATWKLWTETSGNNSEVYLACRSLGSTLKASLHQSGNWHVAYSHKAFKENVEGAIPKFKDRFIGKWPRPPEIAEGITLAFRIVTPYSAITIPLTTGKYKGIKWLLNAPASKATEIDILITKTTVSLTGWPGKSSMGTSLIDSFKLNNGDTVWAVYWIIDMPDLSKVASRSGHFYKGKTREDLQSDGLRALVFGTEQDGSRVIYDCAVQRTSASK